MLQPRSMNSMASQSRSLGWLGFSPLMPKLFGVLTRACPICHCQIRFTITRVVRGLSGRVNHYASCLRWRVSFAFEKMFLKFVVWLKQESSLAVDFSNFSRNCPRFKTWTGGASSASKCPKTEAFGISRSPSNFERLLPSSSATLRTALARVLSSSCFCSLSFNFPQG